MNSIKQVPTRVRSRRVEANLGAEREHFEKQQVNAENGAVRLLFCVFHEKTPVVFTPAVAAPHSHKAGAFVSDFITLALKMKQNTLLSEAARNF